MSSAITTLGQTRINQLRGDELPLVIDRMVLALIPGLDPAAAVDRSQQMPDPGEIVHTAVIAADHKGYVDPDQVVYSIVLGSDIGDFSFNWIGLIEETTDTVIAITTLPETQKYKTNIGNNTTGNNITRNFMIQFQDAQNLTGIAVAAETWQFDYQAELTSHYDKIINPTQNGTEKKHLTDTQAKKWEDHVSETKGLHTAVGIIQLLPFRYDELPPGWNFCNGDNVLLASAVGQVLNGLPANFKSDWGIAINDIYISLPNLFHVDGRGLFLRAVDGTTRQVGVKELDGLPNITGSAHSFYRSGFLGASGALSVSAYGDSPAKLGVQGGDPGDNRAISFNASNSNGIYGASSFVTPLNIGMTPSIYLGE